MRRTYTTTMPDRVGAFLGASRYIAEEGANITRVSYNKAIDMHLLFLEVDGTIQQLIRIEERLKEHGYLPESLQQGKVMMMEFKLRDVPGTVLPVLELIDSFHFNISYISSQENGGAYQYFKMGLFVEDSDSVSRFMREVSLLCQVKIIHYDRSEKNLDNTVFYLNFANTIAKKASLSEEDSRQLMVCANQIMQLLDERDRPPYKTFDYISRFAEQIYAHKGEQFEPRISSFTGRKGAKVTVIEPPTGCNLTAVEKDGQFLFVDSGFACYREELLQTLRKLIPGYDRMEKTAIISHGDVDHCGLLDFYDRVYMSEKCLQNFRWEAQGAPNYRERNPLHQPYVRISKLLSDYHGPELYRLRSVGGSLEEPTKPLVRIGDFSFASLRFEAYEGFGGHVAGEIVWIERNEGLVFTGDVLVNLKGFIRPQAEFNRLAPFLMTSVDTDAARAAEERLVLDGLLEKDGAWLIFGGHGAPIERPIG
ncbi:MAG: Zn-dependent hydrolase [Eubacteriales bacterium]|nr:Zn-dependent hydrolase [Eubacteriales bacterium]